MDKLAEQLAALTEKLGPQFANAAVEAARMEAYSSLVANVYSIIIGLLFIAAAYGLWLTIAKKDNDSGWTIGAVIVAFLACFPLLGGIWGLMDPWLWSTIHNPELWVAKRVLGL